jgi:uncharacterized protein YprB with RNaseH-like and TPR domain
VSLRRKLARLRTAGPGSRGAPAPPPPPEPVVEPLPVADPGVEAERAPWRAALPAIDAEPEHAGRLAKLRGLIGRMIADDRKRLRERAVVTAPEPLPGETVETAAGPVHRVATYLEPHHAHGRVPIARATTVDPSTVARLALDEALGGLDPRRLLFVDTETTGLAGGTGTLPFLIGLAWFEDQSLRVEQLLLRRPGEEAPMLRRLAERIEAASGLVTYNGKSYDWPLLRTRFVLNRVPVATPALHLDLLHCARRVFRRRLRTVRLTQMEEAVLGMRRERDIDGAEIPDRYWEYVRGDDGSRLAPVIEHNANDLIALAAILVVLVERYETLGADHAPEDRLGVAEVAQRAADPERAARYAEAAAEAGGPEDVTADAWWLAAELARKRGAGDGEREGLLLRALGAAADDEARRDRAHLALAKLYEHRVKDFGRALVHARSGRGEADEARDKRIARLERKAARRRGATPLFARSDG